MAANDTIGLNIELPIYNADGTVFHNLVLHKSTYDSIVMSLSDKITGDVYYPNNQLSVTMQEYVELDGVKFVLVNPPTVVKEGMVSDNSQLNGMTKYSFVFYHPMYMLNNFPFRDVAVTSDQTKYLSESKKFSWIGYPDDFIAKLNKNLVGTEWIVEKSDRFPAYLDDQLSEVLPFDDNTIGDALKVGYDTWGAPYVIGKVASTEASYASGKRFKVIFGLPSNEIYEDASHQQLNEPFVFQFGQGVGLKNNSRTPRNNKIITRISGCGSENNIPYGYPQIPWYGDSRWDWTEYEGDTINYDADGKVTNTPKTTAYPLYMGILGGAYVKLIKHPFTRTNLMPSIYSQTLFNKVSPYNSDGTANENYNPNTTLIDYYDAIATQEYPYPNPIVASAPSYESHQFDDIKPELGTDIAIVDAWPINDADLQPASSWDDSIDDDGNYKQGYFKMTLPVLTFDLYACAAITEEMQINMRGGACLGCTFAVQVDWDDYKNNFYDSDGNFAPTGSQRDYTKYPDTTQEQVTIILQKETATFGTLMPNMYQHPVTGDTFVVLGISLPTSYISNAESRLDGEMKSYMLENNVHYFDYPLKFDEAFLRNYTYILQQIKPNSVIRFKYGNDTLQLFVKQLTVKYGEKVLPQYDITLTDNVEVVLNQIGRVADDVEKLSALIAAVRQNYSRSVWAELEKKLSKTQDDTAQGFIRFMKGLQVGNQFVSGLLGEGGVFRKEADGTTYLEADKMYIRMKAYFDTVEIREYQHTAGNRIASVAGNKCVRVAWFNSSNVELEQTQANLSSVAYFRCYFRASDGEDTVRNNFVIGDQVYCHITSVAGANDNPNEKGLNQKHYWRLCIGRNTEGTLTDDGEAWIDISNRSSETLTIGGTQYTHAGYQTGSDVPEPQDSMVQLGNINDVTRQGAIIEFVTGADAPSYQIYQGINAFDLTNKNQISIGYNSATGHAKMDVFGDAYIGDRNRSTYIEYKQNGTNNQPELNIKARVQFTNTQEMSQFVKDNQNNYDDSELQQAVSDLNDVTDNLQSQIDGAIETIYGDVDPTEEGNDPYEDYTTAEKEKHIGDMYYDTVSGYAYRYDKTVEEGVTTYHWTLITDSGITEAIAKAGEALGVANTKAKIFSTNSGVLPTPPYKVNDVWVNATGTWGSGASAVTWSNEILKCITACPENGVASISHWAKASKYTDDSYFENWRTTTYANYVTNTATAIDNAGNRYLTDAVTNAIKAALGGTTIIDGGLMLTSMIALRQFTGQEGEETDLSKYTTWAGISGTYIDRDETATGEGAKAKGHGIAAWYGGGMVDLDDLSDYWTSEQIATWNAMSADDKAASSLVAKSLFRFDGSGYLASNNIKWTADGKVYLANLHTSSGHEISQYFFDAFAIGIDGTMQYINPQYSFNHIDIIRRTGAGAVTLSDNSVLNRAENDARYITKEYFESLFNAIDANGQKIDYPTTTGIDSIKALFGFWTNQYLSALGQGSDGGGGGTGDVTWALLASDQDTRQIAISHLDGSDGSPVNVLSTLTSFTTSGKNYAVVKDASNHLYVNVPWSDTTYSVFTDSANGLVPMASSGNKTTAETAVGNYYLCADGKFRQLPANAFKNDNTKNTAGTTNNASKKLFLVGALEQSANPVTYSNVNVYIGTDNCLYSNGTKVLTAHQSLVDLMGSTAIGTTKKPIYWTGSAFSAIGYTIEKSVPSNAVFTDHYDWTDITTKPTTLSGYGITDAKMENNVITLGDKTSTRIIPLEDNGTTTGGTWLAKNSDITEYYDGLIVLYKITVAGASTTTLKINNLTAKTVYRVGTTKLTKHYGVGTYLILYYSTTLGSGSWQVLMDYDANNYAYVRQYKTAGDVEYPLLSRYDVADTTNYVTEYSRFASGVTLNPSKNSITASKFIVTGGVSTGFLKADGSVDSTSYGLASDVTTLQGYFTNGVANSAAKLTTVSKTAWGQTYWTANGVPDTIKGAIQNTGNITPETTATSSVGSSSLVYASVYANALYSAASTALTLGINGTAYATINTSGNLLVGTTTSRAKVTVNGSVYPLTNNKSSMTLGGSSYRWYNLYSVSGDFSGAVTMSSTLSVTGATTLTGLLTANGGIVVPTSNTIKIGDAYLSYDSNNSALRVSANADGTGAMNFYAVGGIAALGETGSGGGGGQGDVTWELLATAATGGRTIHSSYISGTLASYSLTTHTHATSIATSTGTNQLTLAYGTKYALTAGGTSFIFTMPSNVWGDLTDKPTTISGYGISDAYTKTELESLYMRISAYTNFGASSENVVDLNNVTTYGVYRHTGSSNQQYITNKPSGCTGVFILVVERSAYDSNPYIRQRYQEYNSSVVYERYSTNTGSTWSNWVKVQGNIDNYLPLSGTSATTPMTGPLHFKRSDWDYRLYVYDTGDTARYFIRQVFSKDETTNIQTSTFTMGDGATLVQDYQVANTAGYQRFTIGNTTKLNAANNRYGIIRIYGKRDSSAPSKTVRYVDFVPSVTTSNRTITIPNNSGTLALTSDIPTNNNQLTNGAGYITSAGSCAYATSSGDSDTVDGLHVTQGANQPFGTIPAITSSGWMDIGTHLEFHYDNTTGSDFSTVLRCTGNHSNIVSLPSNSGVLALVDDIPTNNNQLTNGAGYVTSSGVTSVATGTGLTGGTITSTGTISISSTYRTYISHGESAYNSLSNYLPLTGGTLSGNLTIGTDYHLRVKTIKMNEYAKIYTRCVDNQSSVDSGIYYDFSGTEGTIFANGYSTAIYKFTIGQSLNDVSKESSAILTINTTGVGVNLGTSMPSYSLHVSGDIYATGGITALSDARHKQVVRDTDLSVEQIANMPSVIFKWTDGKHDDKLHAGSLAQNWRQVLPEVVLEAPDKEHTLSLSYGVAALVAAITTARKVVDHERRIKDLERENSFLKEQIKQLKAA